jgi:DNA invertase Pin-like site-specific DNA recombinase
MLKALLDNLKAGKIRARVLLIERLDRLTREGMTTGINLMMDILRTGIEVHSTVSGRIFKFPKDATAEFMLAMEVGIEFF